MDMQEKTTLANVNTMIASDKEQGSRSIQTLNQEKHERIARNSLYDMFIFHEALEKEILRLNTLPTKLTETEAELLACMLAVQKHYHAALKGFKELSVEMQQHAVVRLSDSLIDLMKILHRKGH